MEKVAQYYQIFCNLSLDVVAGVFFSMLPLPVCFGVQMPLIWYVALPASAWIIYLLDHVVDVLRKKEEYPTPRHRFIKKYLNVIVVSIIALSISTGIAVLRWFNPVLFACGAGMSVLVAIHLLIVQVNPQGKSLLNNKETAIAILYATGIYIGPLSNTWLNHQPPWPVITCYLVFFCITCINLLMASLIEYHYDEQMGNSSWVRVVSKKKAETIFSGLVMAAISASVLAMPFVRVDVRLLLLCYILMVLGHVIVYRMRAHLEAYLAYRKVGEVLFWLPALVYLLVK